MPETIAFQTKVEVALAEIRRAGERGIPEGVVLADAGYGTDTGSAPDSPKWNGGTWSA